MRWRLIAWLIRPLIVQGPWHQSNITRLFRIVRDAAQDEFREDNKPTLDAFLEECFEASKEGATRNAG